MGYSVGAIKHIHHQGFTIDTEGKNTWRFSKAGAKVVVAVSPNEIDVIKKTQQEPDNLETVLALIKDESLDLLFTEGFHYLVAKRADIPKIVSAKNTEDLKSTLGGTVEPILAVTGMVAKTADPAGFGGLQFVRIPEEGDRLVEQIKQLLHKQSGY